MRGVVYRILTVAQTLLGFAPDLDPRTPGVITAGSSFLPTIRGIAAAPAPNDIGIPVLTGNATCLGAASIRILSGGRRLIAGTTATLLELSGTNSWVNRSKSGGYATGGGRWRFTQFGDVTIATNRTDIMQASLPGANFVDLIGSPPKARFIDTVGLFVVVADTNEALFGDQPDRWWCSGLGNHQTWVPSITTQSASGRLLDADGPITASRGLGNSWILYKRESIYVGSYVGGDVIWAFERVPGNIGCVSHDSIVNLQSAHIFRGLDDFYLFDGNRASPIGRNVKEFYGRRASLSFNSRVLALHDRANTLIYFFYPSTSSSGEADSGLVFNYEAAAWGVHNLSVQAATEFISGQLTWDQLGNIAATWDDLPKISWDDPFWVSGAEKPSVFMLDAASGGGKLMPLSGAPGKASMTTWETGDLRGYTGFSRVLPRFSRTPEMGTLIGMYSGRSHQGFQSSEPSALVDGRFSYIQNALLHKFTMEFTGDFEMVDIDFEAKRSSSE